MINIAQVYIALFLYESYFYLQVYIAKFGHLQVPKLSYVYLQVKLKLASIHSRVWALASARTELCILEAQVYIAFTNNLQ